MTKQDAPTTTDAERADYEKWVLTERPSLLKNTTCLGGDQVEIHVDQIAWIAYQAGASSQAARASSAAAQPVEPSKPLYAQLADSLRPFLKPGDKVIWRMPFRWHDDNGVMPNHYDGHELEGLAADFGYQIDWDFNLRHAAIVRAAPPAKPTDTAPKETQ